MMLNGCTKHASITPRSTLGFCCVTASHPWKVRKILICSLQVAIREFTCMNARSFIGVVSYFLVFRCSTRNPANWYWFDVLPANLLRLLNARLDEQQHNWLMSSINSTVLYLILLCFSHPLGSSMLYRPWRSSYCYRCFWQRSQVCSLSVHCHSGDGACTSTEIENVTIKWAYTAVSDATCSQMMSMPQLYANVGCCNIDLCNLPMKGTSSRLIVPPVFILV